MQSVRLKTAMPNRDNSTMIDDSTALSFKPVFKILDDAITHYATRPALNFEGKHFTYKELGAIVDKVAAGLQNIGVEKGTKVGLYMPNTQYSVIFYYAILKAGGTVVNYNPLYAIRELKFQAENSETDILITLNSPDTLERAETLLSERSIKKIVICPTSSSDLMVESDDQHVLYDDLIHDSYTLQDITIVPDTDIAVLQYTGGTTGVPKAAMLTHKNVSVNVEQFCSLLDGSVEYGVEKTLGILPLFHVFAMTVVMNFSLRIGAEIILVPRFDPKLLAPILKDKKPTIIPAVPAAFAALAKHPATCDFDLSYTKLCVAGGAPTPKAVKELFETKTGARIIEAYGLTEASPVTNSNPPNGVLKVGSIGPVIAGTEIKIVDLEQGKTSLAQGEAGEVCFRGPQVMKGYYKNEPETANTIREGWLHTGDIGYIDEDGYVFLLDRLKDMILVSGYNVYPTQVEAQIYTHPSVEECLVAGVKDEKRGEVVWAWVKPKDGETITDNDIKAHLKDKLSQTEIPRRIVIRDTALPKTAVGKLSRKLLLDEEGLA